MRAALRVMTRRVCVRGPGCALFSLPRAAHSRAPTRIVASLGNLRSVPRSMLFSSEDKRFKNTFDEDPHSFHDIVDATLHQLVAQCEELESRDIAGFDCLEHDGVFELKLGKLGTFVINKQTPNRQLWFSSPISGPKRYNYDMETQTWRNTRDGHELTALLSAELSHLLGFEFSVVPRK